MLPVEVADFRTRYRAAISVRYRGWLHFATTTVASLVVVGFASSRVHAPTWLELAAIPMFFLFANVAEYLGHRGPMHHRRRGLALVFERHTQQHHRFYTHEAMAAESPRDFQMVLFPPIMLIFFLGCMATPIGLGLAVVGTPNLAWLFVATSVGYFLTYEWLHFSYHQPEASWIGRRALVRHLRRHHAIHHDPTRMTSVNFNITFPIADRVFGTLSRTER